jgi:hypothetical protein
MAPRIALVGADGDSVGAAAPGRVSTHRIQAAVVAALVAALLVGAAVWKFSGGGNAAIASSSEITAAQLEQQYGVRIDVVGLIAGGGLVELKFQVTDADKATALFGEVDDMPLLAVEGSSTVLQSAKGMKHSLTLLDGASYFFLYTNVGDAVHDGSQVAFVVNGVRLAHLTVLR